MPDAVLTRDGPVSVPQDYKVPQSGELLPLTVRATIDGTSAASSFYATVQVLSPSGRIMGSYISDSIAAGASRDVTWFPGLGGNGTNTIFSSGLMAARVNITGSINIPEGDPGTFITWGEAVVDTGSPTPFWNAATPLRLTAPVNGVYMDLVNLEWSTLALASQPGYVAVYLYKNGAASPAYFYDVNTAEPQGGSGPPYNLTGVTHGIFPMNAGDYWEILAYNNNAGGTTRQLIDLRPTENHYSSFSMILVGLT